jgi:carbonic anhydrase/acetyltransferase-like protein (isoleucine patch superfamily)
VRPTRLIGAVAQRVWEHLMSWGAIGPRSRRAKRFRSFGTGSAICFPVTALYGERYMRIGEGTIVGPYASLSAGVSPQHELGDVEVLSIGDHVLIGKGSAVVAHERVVIGDHVFTGHNVYVTDANHGYEDVDTPIGQQFAPTRPVAVGAGSWLGHGTVVLPGVSIGEHVVIGAGSVVTSDIPDRSVAVGNPARVIRQYIDGQGWVEAEH